MILLKHNIFVLFLEIYTIATLLFDFELPGTRFFNDNSSKRLLVSLLPLTFTFISKYTEGWTSITFPTLLCSLLIPFGSIIEGLPKLGFAVIVTLLAISHANAIRYFPIKPPLKPTGKFHVGYKSYKAKGDLKYSVFYPTLEQTFNHPKFIGDDHAWRKYLEIAQGMSKFPPKWLFEVATHMHTKLPLMAHVNAPIVSKENFEQHEIRKFIPIIFSHGLGGNQHSYASLICQLASQGFFVISVDHQDEVKDICTDIEKKPLVYLEMRVKEIRKLIDQLGNKSGSIQKLFGSDIEFDMSHLTVMGHSYGGASAYKTASLDERVKHCILLDPWLASMSKDDLDTKLKCTFLLFESGDWNERHPYFEVTERNLRAMEGQRNNDYGAIYCKIPKAQHNNFTDDVFYSGGILKFLKIINDIDASVENYKENIQVLDNYLLTVVAKGQKSDEFIQMYKDSVDYPLKKFA